MSIDDTKTIGVVIPVFGHSRFVAEAIVSACEQETEHSILVVVVDDGCLFPETGETAKNLLAAYPGKLFYLRQANTRLPGARNSGVRFLLGVEPTIDAFFFLDADNRLSPYSLNVFYNRLAQDETKGWAYPDISFFGWTTAEHGAETRETAPVYSKLKHLVSNISEAGSMVRAGVFHAGVWFDETMTSGFEDWDFWLSALDAGFEGVRAEGTGFMYRVRPESMLAESQRIVDTLVAKIRAKHSRLFSPVQVMNVEHKEAPSFAVYLPEDQTFKLFSDPLSEAETVTLDEFRIRFHDWADNHHEHFFPQQLAVMPTKVWQELSCYKRLNRWLFWNLRETKQDKVFVSFAAGGWPQYNRLPYGGEPIDCVPAFLLVNTQVLWRRAQDKTVGIAQERSAYWALMQLVPDELGVPETVPQSDEHMLTTAFEALAKDLVTLPKRHRHASRFYSGPHVQAVRELLVPEICALENREPFPASSQVSRTLVSFSADTFANPKARARIFEMLHTIRQVENREILLMVEGEINSDGADRRVVEPGYSLSLLTPEIYCRLTAFADDIVFLGKGASKAETFQYLGSRYIRHFTPEQTQDAAIIAKICDELIVFGAVGLIEIFGDARKNGAKTYAIMDSDIETGLSHLAARRQSLTKLMVYEHAISGVITDQVDVKDKLRAFGFPSAKLLPPKEFFGKRKEGQSRE
jgi:glycosyltransferase involved in cell wall biosynthesis